jgi:Domain of unknown function (DUF4375)
MNEPLLKTDMFDTMSDLKLIMRLYDFVSIILPDGYETELAALLTLPVEMQVVYSIAALENQVNNGGFEQFYQNCGLGMAQLAASSLSLIGAPTFAHLVLSTNNEQETRIQNKVPFVENEFPFEKNFELFRQVYQVENLDIIQAKFIRGRRDVFLKFPAPVVRSRNS